MQSSYAKGHGWLPVRRRIAHSLVSMGSSSNNRTTLRVKHAGAQQCRGNRQDTFLIGLCAGSAAIWPATAPNWRMVGTMSFAVSCRCGKNDSPMCAYWKRSGFSICHLLAINRCVAAGWAKQVPAHKQPSSPSQYAVGFCSVRDSEVSAQAAWGFVQLRLPTWK